MRLRVLLASLLLFPASLLAQPRVVVTILPIHSITAALMQDVGKPELLIPATSTPHHFTLRPSQRKSLEHAELIIWVGAPLEGFMPRILKSLPEEVDVLTLLESSEPGEQIPHEHSNYQDPHIWLDPVRAIHLSERIRDALVAIDPEHSTQYRQNAMTLRSELEKLDAQLSTSLSEVRSQPFIVFHNAYGYLVDRYGLNQVGSVTLDEHHQPGGKHLQSLRKQIVSENVRCLFTEPQFTPAVVENLVSGTSTRTATLDPIGVDHAPGPGAYFKMMNALGHVLAQCLSEE